MKTILIIAIALLMAQVLQAQVLNPVSNSKVQTPIMKEWWRADDKGYGINGMTWLKTFYRGKSVLAVSTPSGVETWLLSYPGDTVNVFTWKGGDAHIQSGDFNGDGITDYLDGKGNLYIGQSNDLPNAPVLIQPIGASLNSVCDLNNDGIDDLISVSQNNSPILFSVKFGDTTDLTLQKPSVGVGIFFDSSRSVVSIYSISKHRHRVLVRYAPYYYDSQRHGIDGLELYELNWSAISAVLEFTKLSSIVVNPSGQSWIAGCLLQPNDSSVYRIQAERIDLSNFNFGNSNMCVYDLSHDSLDKINSTYMDSVRDILPITTSVDADSTSDIAILKQGATDVNFVSGYNLQKGLSLISKATFCQAFVMSGVSPLQKASHCFVCAAGKYLVDDYPHTCFCIEGASDTTSSKGDDSLPQPSMIIRVLPNPTQKNNRITVETISRTGFKGELSLVNSIGSKYVIDANYTTEAGKQVSQISLPTAMPNGKYILQLHSSYVVAQCSFIIE